MGKVRPPTGLGIAPARGGTRELTRGSVPATGATIGVALPLGFVEVEFVELVVLVVVGVEVRAGVAVMGPIGEVEVATRVGKTGGVASSMAKECRGIQSEFGEGPEASTTVGRNPPFTVSTNRSNIFV